MKKLDLKSKKILYIGPVSFSYDRFFIKKLREFEAHVDPFELYPDTIFVKAIRKLNPSYLEIYYKKYFNKVILKGGYDYILVRHGYQLTMELLQKLRELNPGARLINFHWDSIKPYYNYVPLLNAYDKVFSFDYKDCHDHQLCYLPLFYLDIYGDHAQSKCNYKKEIDILFIGSWRNKERYDQVKLTDEFCKPNGLKFFYFLHYSVRDRFKLLKKGIIARGAKSKSLSHPQILNYFAKASCIIDFPSSFQTGLTMRSFEALGAGKKLITTNQNIVNEPFYNPEYISIINPENFKIDIDFVKNTPKSKMVELIENYSIGSYIYKLLKD